MRILLLTALCLSLTACGFQPLHSRAYRAEQAIDLSSVSVVVKTLEGARRAELLEAEIEDAMNPDYQQAEKQYLLMIQMTEADMPLFINPDGTSARGDIQMTTNYSLTRIADNSRVDTGRIKRVSSYNTSDQAAEGYASYVSVEDAKKRAILELGQDYKLRMANLLSKLSARQ